MNRRSFCGSLASLVLLEMSRSFVRAMASGQEPVPAESDDDSYAIWSILIPVLRPGAKEYLIPVSTEVPEVTVSLRPAEPLPQIKLAMLGMTVQVPGAAQAMFQDAAAHFNEKGQKPLLLGPKFHLPHPYKLMTDDDMAEYRRMTGAACIVDANHPWHKDRRLERKYAGFSEPCYFSRVYFDNARRLGLVWDGSTVFCFQKEDGGWTRRDWPAAIQRENC
jgi:hypothetical protein